MNADFDHPNFISDELDGSKRTIEDIKDFTGFGLDNCIHWDLNYIYIIDLIDKSLKIIDGFDGERLGKISFENIYNKTEEELMDGLGYTRQLLQLCPTNITIGTVGKKAFTTLNQAGFDVSLMRHPANGGAGKFRQQFTEWIGQNRHD